MIIFLFESGGIKMRALERITNTSSNLTSINADLYGIDDKIKLLKQHIEDFIFRGQKIVVSITSRSFGCWNTINVDGYNLKDNCLYLNNGNFDIHINFDGVQVEYDDTLEDSFIITAGENEITFNFL